MLKLVAASRDGRRTPVKRGQKRLARLAAKAADGVEIGGAIQRAIARGRRRFIDVHDHLQGAAAESDCRPSRARGSARLSEAIRRLTDIHQRLLFFSASVEMEMDRLDVLRAEIDRLLASAKERRT